MTIIIPSVLGSANFKADYGLKYAYLAGAMYKGIASAKLVIKLGHAGFMGYLGTGGLRIAQIENDIRAIQQQLNSNQAYGMNLLCNLIKPEIEDETIDLYFKYHIKNIEAAAYMKMTSSLVRYRLKGVHLDAQSQLVVPHRILAKVSRPEVAEAFMSPAPAIIVRNLVEAGKLTTEEAQLSEYIPMAYDICVEADSGGHTDQGVAYVLMPAMLKLRNDLMAKYQYTKNIHVGAAGGIGTPEAAAAAFMLGADFIMTGSINQCTVEANMSDVVKDMLQTMNVQDTTYAPAGDMFEIGAKMQVLRKGLFFPARANKLYELYRQHNSLDDIDEKILEQIQEKYFRRNFSEVWQETHTYYLKEKPEEIIKAEQDPKYKMALIFRWYFIHTARLAKQGSEQQRVDYQIHCGPALGAFNQWVKGTSLENWRCRHVDEVAEKLMQETANLLTQRYKRWFSVLDVSNSKITIA